MSNIRDVAEEASVHPSTVSRVFSGNAQISAETRERVLAAAQKLGFQPNAIARSLSVQRTNTIGVVVPHVFAGYFQDIFFPQLMAGLLEVCYEQDYRLLVSGCAGYDDEIVQALDILGTRQADGFVVSSSRLDVNTVGELQEKGTPFVLIGHPPSDRQGVAWVDADNRGDTRRVIEYLLGRGHRRIAYVGGDPDSSVTKERLEGYRDALRQAGVAEECGWVTYGYFAEEGGYDAVARSQANPAQAPTAYYAANDLMAVGVMRRLQELGLDVPGDVSVVGTNDSPEAAHLTPALTTLRVPYRQIAAEAAQMLIDAIQSGETPRHSQLIPCQLIERESVGDWAGE